MRVTVCELPHQGDALINAWRRLCEHVSKAASELVVLPELAFSGPVWVAEQFDLRVREQAEADHARCLPRLSELGVPWVIGTRPVTDGGARFNEGFLWSASAGSARLRRKYLLPEEAEGWETRWFARGDQEFPSYAAGGLSFGLNICTELWALESFAAYRRLRVGAVVSPRATAAATTEKWIALGTVAAVASGAYCISSNRVHPDGSCGGVGWVIDPDGHLLARTSGNEPWCTHDVDRERVDAAATTYPRYVLDPSRVGAGS